MQIYKNKTIQIIWERVGRRGRVFGFGLKIFKMGISTFSHPWRFAIAMHDISRATNL